MATYAELRTRVAGEMLRDDLLDESLTVLKDAIKASIRHYQTRDWWFLTTVASAVTVASQDYVTRPATIEQIHTVSIPALGWELCREPITSIEAWDEPSVQTGQPVAYAEEAETLRLWPVPNAVFTLKIVGTAKPAELSNDSDTNIWTTTGLDLIVAETKRRLFMSFFRDLNAAGAAQAEVQTALDAIERQNVSRLSQPVTAGW